jgi:hypothetical protein
MVYTVLYISGHDQIRYLLLIPILGFGLQRLEPDW